MLHRILTVKPSKACTSLATTFLALSVFAGCGGEKSTLAEVEALKEKVCACADAACVTALRESSKGLEKKLAKLSGDEMDKALAHAVSMMECATKLGVPADGL